LVNSTVELNSFTSIVGCSARDLLDRLLHRLGDRDRRGADAAHDLERDDALVVDEGVLGRLGGAVDDLAEVGEAELRPSRSTTCSAAAARCGSRRRACGCSARGRRPGLAAGTLTLIAPSWRLISAAVTP
jgi:hypothetical protein